MKRTQHGFTLLELMTALSVLAILVAIAAPSLRSFAANSRISAAANSVVNTLAVARSEALRRSTPVAVCASSDSQTCNSSDWGTGWVVFTDSAGTRGVLDSTDQLLQAWRAPGNGVTISVAGANNYVRFDARGMNSELTTETFTVKASGCSGTSGSQILVTVAGSPESTKVACP